ncbi:hypothetical protein [Salinarimonas sp.]|uniref:hypothetical protein n=1 Tax=Salinarimonas sp. TaxID=2766526 RepID=UPI00391A7932
MMTIKARDTLLIPGEILSKPEPVRVDPQGTIRVPADYGNHLVHDRFADAVPERARPAKAEDEKKGGGES